MASAIEKYREKFGTAKKKKPSAIEEYRRSKGISSKKIDINTVEGLAEYARQQGLGREVEEIVNPKEKMSFLQRLSSGLGAFNPAEAFLTGREKGAGAGIGKYIKGVGQGIAGAITGTNYQGDRRTFSDVAEEFGVENGIAKFGIGFLGDVLLDPSTYFGGAIARGLTTGVKAGTNIGLKGVGKVAPATETGLRMAGTGLKDAFGKAFVPGYKASDGALIDTLTFLNKRDRANIGLAASNLSRLGTKTLSDDQSQELALKLIAGKREEFLARQAGLPTPSPFSSDPVIQAAIKTQKARTAKFAKQSGVENPYETYFPFIKKEKLEPFLKDVSARGIQVGSEGYLKQFRNLLTNEALELDPVKAFFTSESKQVTNRMTRDFLTGFAKKYGRQFENADEAAKAGFRVLKEKGLYGKEVGYINQYDYNVIQNLIDPGFQTINMLAKASGFDALTNLFKRSVTGLFVPFHIRNYASGLIQNYEAVGLAALNPKTIAAGQKLAYHLGKNTEPAEGVIQIAGKSVKMSKVFKAFKDRFGSDTFYHNDFLQAVEEGALKSAEKTFSKSAARSTLGFQKGNLLPLVGNDGIPFRTARAIGQFIEHQQKATAYLGALSQGKNIPQALALAERAGFDYRSLTAFESQIMKRIIPFYSFTRKNIELQLRTLGENPQRINQVLSFFENIGDRVSEEERKQLPQYIQDSLGVKLDDLPNGIKQYISSFGTPIEAFATLFGGNPVLQTISTMNPVLKVPVELGIGKDSFRQKDLKDVYDASEYKGMPQVVKDLLNITEVQKDILDKQANGKLKKTGERTVYVADPERLLIARSLFTSRGVTYLDQLFGGDMQGFVKALKLTTGIKPQQVDLELNLSMEEKKQKRALEDLLKKRGADFATFTRAFIPD